MTHPNFNSDPEFSKKKTKDNELKQLKHKAEKEDYEIMLKPPKIDNEFCKEKDESLNKKKVFMIVPKILIDTFGLRVGSELTV